MKMTRDRFKRSGVKIKPIVANIRNTKAEKKQTQLVHKLSLEDEIKDIVKRATKDAHNAKKSCDVHLAIPGTGVIPDMCETAARKHKIPKRLAEIPVVGIYKNVQCSNDRNSIKHAVRNIHRKATRDLSKLYLKLPKASPAALTGGEKESKKNVALHKIVTKEVNCDAHVESERLPTYSIPEANFMKEVKEKTCDTMIKKNWIAIDEVISFSVHEQFTQSGNGSSYAGLYPKQAEVEDLKSKTKNSTNANKSKDDIKKCVNWKLDYMTSEREVFSRNGICGQAQKEKILKTKSKAHVNKVCQKRKPVKRKSDGSIIMPDQDSDDDVLYSLSDELCLHSNIANHINGRCKSRISKSENDSSKPSTGEMKVKTWKSVSEVHEKSQKLQSDIHLIESVRKAPSFSASCVSPVPAYTSLRYALTMEMDEHQIQPLLAQPCLDLSTVDSVTAVQACLPVSPSVMSYKVHLKNLPEQPHLKKAGKNRNVFNENIERRVSVRASECAFKCKNIVIKKYQKYTQILLDTCTKIKNGLNPSVIQEIVSGLNASTYDDSNVIVFSGLGSVFCSGIDLHYLTKGDRKVAARNMVDALRDLVHKFITFPKLIVAVVAGQANGFGSALLPLCDIVYASDKATFSLPYAQLAQTPEGCASYTLPRSVGMAMAGELLMGGRRLTAIEACQVGLVSQVFWPTTMMQEVMPRVQRMSQQSGKVLEAMKLLMRSHNHAKLELTNQSECNRLVDIWSSNECQKAMEAFLLNENNYSF